MWLKKNKVLYQHFPPLHSPEWDFYYCAYLVIRNIYYPSIESSHGEPYFNTIQDYFLADLTWTFCF